MTYVESRKQKKKKPITKSFFLIIILIGILSLGALAIIKGKNLFDPVSIVSTVSAANLKETEDKYYFRDTIQLNKSKDNFLIISFWMNNVNGNSFWFPLQFFEKV